MNLYDSYCYASLQEVADAIQSKPFDSTGYIINSVTVSGVDLTVFSTDIKTALPYQYTITPPACTSLGFNKTYLGISFAESQELAWLMATVLITAWTLKVLKRGL